MGENTRRALLARGFDTATIDLVSERGLTFRSLQQMTRAALTSIGLSARAIETLHSGKRPPIPDSVLIAVLHASRRTCCVCREPGRPIVIHHIRPWSESRDHTEPNLVVVCLEHHDLAHTKKGISLGLTPPQLAGHKKAWLTDVSQADGKAVLGLSTVDGARWDFINHRRLFELARTLSIDLRACASFRTVRNYRMVAVDGMLTSPSQWDTDRKPEYWLYGIFEGMHLYYYVKEVLERVLLSLPVVDITNYWSRSQVEALVKPRMWLVVQAAFYFKTLTRSTERDQRRSGRRRRDGIELAFLFDPWDATSSSSYHGHLRGYQTSLVVVQARTIAPTGNLLRITSSCLAIGSNFADARLIKSERPPPSVIEQWSDAINESE